MRWPPHPQQRRPSQHRWQLRQLRPLQQLFAACSKTWPLSLGASGGLGAQRGSAARKHSQATHLRLQRWKPLETKITTRMITAQHTATTSQTYQGFLRKLWKNSLV